MPSSPSKSSRGSKPLQKNRSSKKIRIFDSFDTWDGAADFVEIPEHADYVEFPGELRKEGASTGETDGNSLTRSEKDRRQEAKLRVDEAFIRYSIVENAARKIQENFRRNKLERERLEAGVSNDVDTTEDEDLKEEEKEEEESEPGKWYTLIFLAGFALYPYISSLLSCFTKCTGGNDANPGVCRNTFVEQGHFDDLTDLFYNQSQM